MPRQLGENGFAVIDIGSNSVRMVIYDVSGSPPYQAFNEKVYCALGRDLATTGRLNPDGVTSALKALQAYQLIAESQSVGHIRTVATAAIRDAEDGADFIRMVRDGIGLSIRVLSGSEEARYAAEGVLALDPMTDGVVADFGGGSLELARVAGGQVHDTVSLPLGAFRVKAIQDDPDGHVCRILEEHIAIFKGHRGFYAIGGAWRALAKAHMLETGARQDVQGYSIPKSAVMEFCRRIEAATPAELQRDYRLEDQRAGLAQVAALVLRNCFTVLSPTLFITSMAGVRDGMVHEYLSSKSDSA